MQIHDLNTGTPAATDVLAMDTGSDTYKTTPGNVVPDYTSGDSSTATSWTSVTAVASGLSFSTLIGRITTMMKNVRFLYGLLGTTDISGIGGGTVTGAISQLNSNKSKLQYIDVQPATAQYAFQINSASGGVVGYNNFVSMYVIDTNSVVALAYTYSNLIYAIIKNSETMVNASPAIYKVRVWYRAE